MIFKKYGFTLNQCILPLASHWHHLGDHVTPCNPTLAGSSYLTAYLRGKPVSTRQSLLLPFPYSHVHTAPPFCLISQGSNGPLFTQPDISHLLRKWLTFWKRIAHYCRHICPLVVARENTSGLGIWACWSWQRFWSSSTVEFPVLCFK